MKADWEAKLTGLSRKATWPLVYSIGPRVLVGLKFLAVARLLGPQEFGLYALAFLWLTVMEGISDFGFRQAIVQNRDDLNDHQLGQINTVQLVRGLALIPLVAGATWLARDFLGEGFLAVVLVSLVPMARGFYGIPVAVAQRKMDFKGLAGFEFSWRAIDLVMCLAAALIWKNSFAVVVASILGEFSGLLVSFVWLRVRITFARPTSEIASLVKYGRWIWGQTILTLLLNQFDKFYVAGRFGLLAVGAYQGINRLTQLLVADPINMASSILFPKLSQIHRSDAKAAGVMFVRILGNYAAFSSLVVYFTIVFKRGLVRTVFGAAWVEYAYLLPIFMTIMIIGSTLVLLTTWFRSIGRPGAVTCSTAVQSVVYLGGVFVLGEWYGMDGVAYSVLIGAVMALLVLLYFLGRSMLRSMAGKFQIQAALLVNASVGLDLLRWNTAVLSLLLFLGGIGYMVWGYVGMVRLQLKRFRQ